MTETAKELAKPFNPAALAEQLRDKIRVDMAELMPDDVWKNLLQAEIELFFKERTVKPSYPGGRTTTEPPAFRGIVESVMKEEARKRVVEMLSTPEWQGFWEGEKQQAGVALKELIKEAAPDIVAALLSESIQRVVSEMHGNMQRGY